MASDTGEDRSVAFSLPAALEEWLDERAEEAGVDREELLVRLVGAYRVAAGADGEGDAQPPVGASAADVESAVEAALSEQRVDTSASVTEQAEDRLDDFEERVTDRLDEMRRRVVQVKQEVDGRAPDDHDHEEFDRLGTLTDRVSSLESTVSDLEAAREGEAADSDDDGDDEDGRARTGEFDARLDELDRKLTQVARAVVDLRQDRDGTGDGTGPRDDALDAVRLEAAREGVSEAVCPACGESSEVGLLTEAACPHCGSGIAGVEARAGLFSSDRFLPAEGGSR